MKNLIIRIFFYSILSLFVSCNVFKYAVNVRNEQTRKYKLLDYEKEIIYNMSFSATIKNISRVVTTDEIKECSNYFEISVFQYKIDTAKNFTKNNMKFINTKDSVPFSLNINYSNQLAKNLIIGDTIHKEMHSNEIRFKGKKYIICKNRILIH